VAAGVHTGIEKRKKDSHHADEEHVARRGEAKAGEAG